MWLTVKETAQHLEISSKTVRRRLKKGEWESKTEKVNHNGKMISTLFIQISDADHVDSDYHLETCDHMDTKNHVDTSDHMDKQDKSKKHHVDSLDHVDTSEKREKEREETTPSSNDATPPKDGNYAGTEALRSQSAPLYSVEDIMQMFEVSRTAGYRMASKKKWHRVSKPMERGGSKNYYIIPEDEIRVLVDSRQEHLPDFIKAGVVKYDKNMLNLEEESEFSDQDLERAQLKAQLCEAILAEIKNNGKKLKAIESINSVYSSGLLLPKLFIVEGKKSNRTIRMWLDNYVSSDRDFKSLIKLNKVSHKRKATDIEQQFLLKLLLDDKKIKIGSAIRKLKQMERLGKVESPTSERTLRRWCEAWRDSHIQQWNTLRYGIKYLKDYGIMTLLRSDDLQVGDVLVADGHELSFDIIDPISGKAKRMLLILFFDWGSRYPVGATIANTEDSEHILLALRNSIIHMGYLPRSVYLDNGRAFKSKLFHGDWKNHDLSEELDGIYARLGIEVTFAKAYNARAKVVERFFKTFQEDFERYVDTFRGAGIADKPANLMRNEKWIRGLKERKPLELEQAKAMMTIYFQELYGKTPHRGLNNKKPYDVFRSFKAPQERKISVSELNFMMLKSDSRNVRANGIQMANVLYYNDKLIGMVGQKVKLRYDLMDMRSILVYDLKGKFVCQALARETTHPFIKLDKNRATSEKQLKKQIEHQRRLEKDIKHKSNIIRKQIDEVVGEFHLPQAVIDDSNFNNTPMLEVNETKNEQVELDEMLVKVDEKLREEDKKTKDDIQPFDSAQGPNINAGTEALRSQSPEDEDAEALAMLEKLLENTGL